MKGLGRLSRYFIVVGAVIDYALKFAAGRIFGGKNFTVFSPKELRLLLERLGGSFVKFGQLAAVRPDYFPEEYCQELLGLLDAMAPIDDKVLDKIFRLEYGQTPQEAFKKFDRKPISAASFGQVHRAVLANGETAAVKVQRPFAAEDFYADAKLFSFMGWLIKRAGIVKTVDPSKVIRDFIHWTERELDYLMEAGHLERLRKQIVKNNLPIIIPKVYLEYTTPRVLVMEWLEGQTLKSYFLSKNTLPNSRIIFKDIIFFELYSFLFDGFFHADPHPANIIVLPSGQVAFVDAGIAIEVQVSDRKKMTPFFYAVVKNDLPETVRTFFEMVKSPILDMINQGKQKHPTYLLKIQRVKNIYLKKIKAGLADLLNRWHKASLEGGELHEQSPMHKFLELMLLAERSGLKMPQGSVVFARTFLSIDMIILKMEPTFNVPQVVRDFFDGFSKEFLNLRQLPEEKPWYFQAESKSESAALAKALDEEMQAINRELLSERLSAIMESL